MSQTYYNFFIFQNPQSNFLHLINISHSLLKLLICIVCFSYIFIYVQSSSSNSNNRESRSGGSSTVTKVGDWSEHTSSSGKKYYYNCKTEVSQWDQPREWLEAYPASQPSRTQYHHGL